MFKNSLKMLLAGLMVVVFAADGWGATKRGSESVNGIVWSFVYDSDGTVGLLDEQVQSDFDVYYYSVIDENTRGDVVIPDTLGGKPVTWIGQDAFEKCSGITSITMPRTIKSIDDAFNGCISLTNVIWRGTMEEWCKIKFNEFRYDRYSSFFMDYDFSPSSAPYDTESHPCNYAHNLTIDGRNVTSVVIPESVTTINDQAFFGCTNITSVAIPNSVTSIGIKSFYGCSKLTNVVIPNGVVSIGDEAFKGCSKLASINIPDSVTSVGSGVFTDTKILSNAANGLVVKDGWIIGRKNYYPDGDLILPNTVKGIAGGVFKGCVSLTSVTICHL